VSWYEKQITDQPPPPEPTRDERHWRGVRRSARAILAGFGFIGVAFLGDYLDSRLLGIGGEVGVVACWCYTVWAFVDVFKAWFLKNG
jgi:hypothetical protein